MKIKWLGHSCFLLTTATGTRVLTDPFDAQVGYELPNIEVDIATTSHRHFDHAYIQSLRGTFLHFNEPGVYKQLGISFSGIPTFHDHVEGNERGQNIVFVFDIDGLRACHCGDIGHIPSAQQIADIGMVDILFLPVGGVYTVNGAEAYQIMQLLKPAITIPMHFKTPVLRFDVDSVDKFLLEAGLSDSPDVFVHKQEIEVTPANINSFPRIIILDYHLSIRNDGI